MLAASANLTDEQKMKAELFDNKILGLGFSALFPPQSNQLDLARFVEYDFLTNVASFDQRSPSGTPRPASTRCARPVRTATCTPTTMSLRGADRATARCTISPARCGAVTSVLPTIPNFRPARRRCATLTPSQAGAISAPMLELGDPRACRQLGLRTRSDPRA